MICPTYDGCKAPICPIDNSFATAVWYADEPICMSRKFRREHWRIIQRKIVRVNLKNKVEGYFTLLALKESRRVDSRITGLKPDSTPLHSLVSEA